MVVLERKHPFPVTCTTLKWLSLLHWYADYQWLWQKMQGYGLLLMHLWENLWPFLPYANISHTLFILDGTLCSDELFHWTSFLNHCTVLMWKASEMYLRNGSLYWQDLKITVGHKDSWPAELLPRLQCFDLNNFTLIVKAPISYAEA